jgi:hypothetical protein
MAYMSKEHAATIRANLKKNFPNFKFAVQIRHHAAITVSIMSSPLDFSKDFAESNHGEGYIQLNHYYLERYSNTETLQKIYDVINEGNHDNSDPQVDHFDVGFYVNFHIGQWDKPYQQIK